MGTTSIFTSNSTDVVKWVKENRDTIRINFKIKEEAFVNIMKNIHLDMLHVKVAMGM